MDSGKIVEAIDESAQESDSEPKKNGDVDSWKTESISGSEN